MITIQVSGWDYECKYCGKHDYVLRRTEKEAIESARELIALERGDELEPVATCKDYLQVQDALQARITELEQQLETAKAHAVVWHKYPDEKPIEFGRYAIHRRHNVMPRIDVRYWTGNKWRDKEDAIYDRDIAFWAYLPAPPQEGE